MTTKNCAVCNGEFTYIPPANYEDKRKYCDACKKVKDLEYKAKQVVSQQRPSEPVPTQSGPVNPVVVKPGEIKPPTGEYQSLVYNKTLAANSYEVGKVGDRFKLYFETVEELQGKIAELKRAGFMTVEEVAAEFQ